MSHWPFPNQSLDWKKATNQLSTPAAQVQRVGRVLGADHVAHHSALPHVWYSARDEMSRYDLGMGIQRPVCHPTCKHMSVSTWLIT